MAIYFNSILMYNKPLAWRITYDSGKYEPVIEHRLPTDFLFNDIAYGSNMTPFTITPIFEEEQ